LTPDYTSAKEYCIFELLDMFLAKEYSTLRSLYIAIDSFWWYDNHRILHTGPGCIYFWSKSSTCSPTFYTLLWTPFDDTWAIVYCILDLMDIFLAKEYSILNLLRITIDSFWWYVSHRVLHIQPNGHKSGKLVLSHELSIQTYRFLLMLYQTDIMNIFLAQE